MTLNLTIFPITSSCDHLPGDQKFGKFTFFFSHFFTSMLATIAIKVAVNFSEKSVVKSGVRHKLNIVLRKNCINFYQNVFYTNIFLNY